MDGERQGVARMKKVLLAIAGEKPDRRIIDYAVELCMRMKARLDVLQIVGPGLKGSAGRIRAQADRFRRLVDSAAAAATFAEVGEPEPFATPAAASVFDDLTVRSGSAAREIIDYVDARRDIVLTLYDPSLDGPGGRELPIQLKEGLPVPLVRLA